MNTHSEGFQSVSVTTRCRIEHCPNRSAFTPRDLFDVAELIYSGCGIGQRGPEVGGWEGGWEGAGCACLDQCMYCASLYTRSSRHMCTCTTCLI